METQIQQVREFHEAFNVDIYETPIIPNSQRCDLRRRLLQEELNEFQHAYEMENKVEVADAITDLMYVLIGTAHEFGMGNILEKCFDEVHANNMSKLGADGKPIYREDGKVLKPEGYIPVDLSAIVNA